MARRSRDRLVFDPIERASRDEIAALPFDRLAWTLRHTYTFDVAVLRSLFIFLIALMREAVEIWRVLGFSEREALAALSTLLHGTVAAVMEGGLAAGMGGCVARGDVGTVERHVAALEALDPAVAALCRDLASRTIPLGLARGTLTRRPPRESTSCSNVARRRGRS